MPADEDKGKKRELRNGRRTGGDEDVSSRSEGGEWRDRQSGHRWKKTGRREGKESDLTLEEIRRAVEEIDQETFVSLEVREAELEARKKCEKMVTEDQEIMAKTPAEQVWESLQKVREKWESETKAEAGQKGKRRRNRRGR